VIITTPFAGNKTLGKTLRKIKDAPSSLSWVKRGDTNWISQNFINLSVVVIE